MELTRTIGDHLITLYCESQALWLAVAAPASISPHHFNPNSFPALNLSIASLNRLIFVSWRFAESIHAT